MSNAEVIAAELDYLNQVLATMSPTHPTFDFLTQKAAMLEERACHYRKSIKSNFQESATKKYLLACVVRYPGLTRVELKELAGIPGSPRRSDTDVFRDYLHALRKDIYIDEYGKCFPRNGLEKPVARIGNVVLDGRVTAKTKQALVFLRDNPGATEAQLRKKLQLRTSKSFRSLLGSLKNKVITDSCGRMFVEGYIPASNPVSLPAKPIRKIEDPISLQVLEQMDLNTLYDWSDLVGFYRDLEMNAKEGFQHFTNMVRLGLVGAKNGKFVRFYQ